MYGRSKLSWQKCWSSQLIVLLVRKTAHSLTINLILIWIHLVFIVSKFRRLEKTSDLRNTIGTIVVTVNALIFRGTLIFNFD
jgi:hypothetical protein